MDQIDPALLARFTADEYAAAGSPHVGGLGYIVSGPSLEVVGLNVEMMMK